MATAPKDFRFGNFVGSLVWLIFWIIVIVSLVGLPLIFIILFYIPLPYSNGEVITPYLFLSMIVDPTRTIPIINFLIHTDIFRAAVFPGFMYAALIAATTIFVERKFLAKMQLRTGPLYAGKVEGILQLMADGLKLISKEIIAPSGADKPIFWSTPIIFAILGFFPLIALLFSWSSNSKYPFIGGLRALHQMIAFEIPFILSALSIVLLSASLNLTDIVEAQYSFWFFAIAPLSAFVFYISSLAELERVPFDLPEAESEIVAGWLTETSGMIYGLIQLGTYLKLYVLAALFVILFMGGWMGPQIFPQELIPAFTGEKIYNATVVNGIFWFTIKTFGMIMLILLPRGINPRIRIDILLHTGWYKLIVLSFINMFIVLALIYGGVITPAGGLQ